MRLKKLGATALVASAVMVGSAQSAVYIAPSDIDQYKQKTDQTFFDMYQNRNSAIGKSVNPNAKLFFASIGTGQRMAEGYTVPVIKQPVSQGRTFLEGTQLRVTFAGKPLTIIYTSDGVRLKGTGIQVKGSSAIVQQKGKSYITSRGKYGATGMKALMTEYVFDTSTGVVSRLDYWQFYSRNCGKWGCSAWVPRNRAIQNYDKKIIDLIALAKGRTTQDVVSSLTAYKVVDETQLLRYQRDYRRKSYRY